MAILGLSPIGFLVPQVPTFLFSQGGCGEELCWDPEPAGTGLSLPPAGGTPGMHIAREHHTFYPNSHTPVRCGQILSPFYRWGH